MFLKKIHIQNFRLLTNVELTLEENTTVIVGRNNSGKTSLTEVLRRFLDETSTKFRLEDFSLSCHQKFVDAYEKYQEASEKPEDVAKLCPSIGISLTIEYNIDSDQIGVLSPFIVDLDNDSNEALIVVRYQVDVSKINRLFNDFPENAQDNGANFFRELKGRISEAYSTKVIAQDPNDPENTREMEMSYLQTLLQAGFISAQRGLDDVTNKDINLLGKILQKLFESASKDTSNPVEQEAMNKLEDQISQIEEDINKALNNQMNDLLPSTFQLFGYPGLNDPQISTETVLNTKNLLGNHTRVQYGGANGVSLPESYNGLGSRNLIFILLRLLQYFKEYKAFSTAPGSHLVFIEEPEVHLHPQMQEAFIGHIHQLATLITNEWGEGQTWPLQIIVTTHSSHIANRASFDSTRYFLTKIEDETSHRQTVVKDLREGLGSTPKEHKTFLHKYMTLTRCDLFFADKAILIEGASERIILRRIIEKEDEGHQEQQLSSQYVSIVEVDGAHAHKFFPLLAFLELPTLIVSDIDAIGEDGKKCAVSKGIKTSNSSIKEFFANKEVTPAELKANTSETKVKDGYLRIAYQVPEEGKEATGRTFEDAFMLANRDMFEMSTLSEQEAETKAMEKVDKLSSKTGFAIKYAIEVEEWNTPLYLKEGLEWLRTFLPSSQL